MSIHRTWLVVVHPDDDAERTLRRACKLADGEPVHLHVVDVSPLASSATAAPDDRAKARGKLISADKRVWRALARLTMESDDIAGWTLRPTEAPPAVAIEEAARELGPEWIVLGGRAHADLPDDALAGLGCPVVTVPPRRRAENVDPRLPRARAVDGPA